MHRILILLACLAAAGFLIRLSGAPPQPTRATRASGGCDLNQGPCTRPLGDGSAVLEITPRPIRAMVDLRFRLRIEGLEKAGTPHSDPPFIDLDMPDMFMGYNRVYLSAEAPGIFSGSGVIVRCPSGIPTWKAMVTVPGKGEVTFVFDVQY